MPRNRSDSAPPSFQDKGSWLAPGAFDTAIKPDRLLRQPDFPNNIRIEQASIDLVNRGIAGNCFTGILVVNTGSIHLCPLVPAFADNTSYPVDDDGKIEIRPGLRAAPIEHSGIKTQNPNPSHLQLASLLGFEQSQVVGFTLAKDMHGMQVYSFTSRSLNNGSFREIGNDGNAVSRLPLPPRPGMPAAAQRRGPPGTNEHGRMSADFAR